MKLELSCSARVVAGVIALCGCARERPAAAAESNAPTQAPAGAQLAPGAQAGRTDPACTAPFDAPQARVALRAATGELKLGILAGLKDSDDENLVHLRSLTAELVRRGATVLLADGDLGDNGDAQSALLSVLTATGLPVLAVAGNRENRGELDAAEAELRRHGAKIADFSHARVVDLGDAVLVGLPGTFDRRHLRQDGACAYVKKDVEATAAALEKLVSGLASGQVPVVLVAAVPPRGEGSWALDVSEGQNVGDPHLTALLVPRRAAFGVFGQVWESGGRAIDGSGRPVQQGVFQDQLYLNPGAAERTAWPMADGTQQAGLAALLTVRGRKAAVEFVRAPPAPSEQRTQ